MSSGDERKEKADGTIDGANRDFSTSLAYEVGSLRVFSNGILQRIDYDDGWEEISSTSFRMKIAPVVGDILHVRYIEA